MRHVFLFSFLLSLIISWEVSGEFVEHENLQNILEEFKERIFEEFEARLLEKSTTEMGLSLAAYTGSLHNKNAMASNQIRNNEVWLAREIIWSLYVSICFILKK